MCTFYRFEVGNDQGAPLTLKGRVVSTDGQRAERDIIIDPPGCTK
jgi:hypothetical protein